jgi:hypothetical protein
MDQPALDDRITPFIPGQLWTGHGQSIEDDPNCTPGSVSKPLLTETIDPESILSSLQRGGGNQWGASSPFDFSANSLLNTGALGGNIGGPMSNINNSNRGNNNNNNNNSNGNRMGAANSNGLWSSNNNGNTNSGSFNSQLSMPGNINNNNNNNGKY